MESRLNRHGDRLAERHGDRVWRLGLDAGFSCPHRTAGRGRGGCSFCSPEAGLAAYQKDGTRIVVELREQIERAVKFSERRYGGRLFFLYFQAYSCTNLPLPELAVVYGKAIDHLERFRPGSLAGMVVSTRPDCFDADKAELLASYARSGLEVWVEMGLQSSNDASLKRIRRGHDAVAYARAAGIAGQAGLRRAVHLILGLPGERREQMMESVEFSSAAGIEGIKFHDLRLARGSAMEREYLGGELSPMHPNRLPALLADCLEILPARVEVMRLSADFPKRAALDPLGYWEKTRLYMAVEAELAARGTRQGDKAGEKTQSRPGGDHGGKAGGGA